MGSGRALGAPVSDLVDALDLGAFYAPYKGDGRRRLALHPRMMVKVLDAYGTGTFSSRKMAGKLEEDIAFRMLAAGNFPQHHAVRVSPPPSEGLSSGVRRGGLPGAGDGSGGVRTGVGRDEGSGEREQAQGDELRADGQGGAPAAAEALLKQGEAVDEAEDARYGEDARGDELPEELKRREDRLAAIRAAKARLAAEQRAMDDARGRKPGQSRNPKGGKPYKREYGEPDAKARATSRIPRAGS